MADSVTGLVGEVRNQRERLETVINSIDDGIVVLDAERHVIAANDAFLVRARHSREQVLGCQCREFTPGGCTVGDCPTLACLASGARQVRHLRAAHAGEGRWYGRRCTPRRSSIPPGDCSRWWRCGATFPSGARRRRTWRNRTGWRRWARWHPGFRTS